MTCNRVKSLKYCQKQDRIRPQNRASTFQFQPSSFTGTVIELGELRIFCDEAWSSKCNPKNISSWQALFFSPNLSALFIHSLKPFFSEKLKKNEIFYAII